MCNLGPPVWKTQSYSLCACLQKEPSVSKVQIFVTLLWGPHTQLAHATSIRAQILCHCHVSDGRVFIQTQLKEYYGDFHTDIEIVQFNLDLVMLSTLKSPKSAFERRLVQTPMPLLLFLTPLSSQHPGPYFLGQPGMAFSPVKMLRSFVSDNRRQIFW